MKLYFSLLLTFFLSTQIVNAQDGLNLPYLIIEDNNIEQPLAYITDFLGSKKNGKSFPICKIVFSGINSDLKFSVEAIDNSWSNLFKYDEVCYGYVVVKNRMYIIFSPKDQIIDFNNLLYSSENFKFFNRAQKPPSWNAGIPIWHYERSNVQNKDFKLVSTENIEVL